VACLLAIAAIAPVAAATFADQRFAPVASMSDTPALDVQTISMERVDDAYVGFILSFSAPFEPPGDGYRVAVSIGDPTAKRTRWTLAMVDGAPVGTVETGDGTQWDPVGETAAQLDPQAGWARIQAQPADVAPASALWVDAELPTPLGSIVSTSSYFAYDALAPTEPATGVVGTAWGWTRDAEGVRVDGAVRIPGQPPTATVTDGVLVLAAPDAPPSLLYGQPVTSAADYVRFASADAVPGDGGYLVVNRVDGEVQLFTVKDGTATEVVGAADRVVPAPGSTVTTDESAPPGTRTVAVDLAEVQRELDLPTDPASVALAVERGTGLANGWVVTASGVAATVASLQAASQAVTDAATPATTASDAVLVADDGNDASMAVLLVIAAVLAVAVIGGVVAAIVVGRERRKRHETLLSEGWYEPDAHPDETTEWTDALAAPADGDLGTNGDTPLSEVAPTDAVAEVQEVSNELVDADQPTEPDVPEKPAEPDESDEADEAEDATIDVADARASQDRALEALEAQFADLFQRADQLDAHRD
jgi:hypothetical protein